MPFAEGLRKGLGAVQLKRELLIHLHGQRANMDSFAVQPLETTAAAAAVMGRRVRNRQRER